MKTKLEMAHEYAIALINSDCEMQFDKFIRLCWNYADAMQAEADKREKEEMDRRSAELRNILNLSNSKPLELQPDLEEWQPDWSQAPDGYNYWAFDGFSKRANWYKGKPYLDEDSEIEDEWNAEIGKYHEAPSFGYTGDWRNSLRKRPK